MWLISVLGTFRVICQTALRHNRNLHAMRVIKYANHEVFSRPVPSLMNFLEDNFCSLINFTLKKSKFRYFKYSKIKQTLNAQMSLFV